MIKQNEPQKDGPVLVIGGAGVDIVGWSKGDVHPATSSPAHIRSSFGGVARNVAENLARMGQPVHLITAVGEDVEGESLIMGLKDAGVGTDAILRTASYKTGAYLAVIDSTGALQFALDDMRVINAITPSYIEDNEKLFHEASLAFVDGNLPKSTLRKVFSLAKKAHLPVCADPTSTTLAAKFRPYLERLYLVTPNSAEATQLCDAVSEITNLAQALEAAKCLVGQGVGIVIITLAEQGLCYASSETSGHIPAINTPITDPTGAGDALSAAVMFALLNEIPLDDAVRLGVSAATLALRNRGAVAHDLSLQKLYDQLVI